LEVKQEAEAAAGLVNNGWLNREGKYLWTKVVVAVLQFTLKKLSENERIKLFVMRYL